MYPRAVPRPVEITFRAGEADFAGELLLPDPDRLAGRGDRVPWVLMIPSWLPRDRDGALDDRGHPDWFASGPMAPPRPGLLRRVAAGLARQGVASFRYDPRGCGASQGDWAASSLFDRIDDARDALGAMRGRPELDLARTGLLGHGEGAAVALSVAVPDPVVSALTLVGPSARSGRDVLRRAAASRGRTGTDRQHPLVAAFDHASEELVERVARHDASMTVRLRGTPGQLLTVELRGWEQAFATPPRALATMLHRSVRLVHGIHDDWADPDESRLLHAVLAGAGNDPGLQLVADAGHDLAEAPDTLIEGIAADLARRLEPRPLPPVLQALEGQAPPGATMST